MMSALLDKADGHVELTTMQQSFADPACGICVGTNTINTMNLAAHFSRGPDDGVEWKEFK